MPTASHALPMAATPLPRRAITSRCFRAKSMDRGSVNCSNNGSAASYTAKSSECISGISPNCRRAIAWGSPAKAMAVSRQLCRGN